jgi:hypothetical protein
LVAIFKDGHVLELNEPLGDLVLVDEETSKKHEWNNEHRSQSNSQLLIREDGTQD